MEKKGYTAVPFIQNEEGGFIVECKSGAEKWHMLLDTGALTSSLDITVAKKLGLKHGDEVKSVGIGGIQKGYEISLRGISIGDFDTRVTANLLPLTALDFEVINSVQKERKLPRIDGLLGHSALRINSAVIDYSTRTLYLRSPLKSLWPSIEGCWVATSTFEDGQERPLDPKAPLRLEFKDNCFHLNDGTNELLYGMHVRCDQGIYTLAFFDPKKELDKELDYEAAGLLKVVDGKLTACLVLDPQKAKGRPDDFTAPAGSGRLLVEFRRDK